MAETSARKRSSSLLLSAIAIPLAWILVDAVLRRSLFGAVKPARVASYIAGAGLSLALWGLAMEAARHPRRMVRGAAVAFLAFLGAFGVGGQAFFRAFSRGYVNRDLVLLAASMPDIVLGYLRARPIVVLGCFALPAAIAGALAVLRARRLGPLSRWSWVAPLGAAVTAIFIMLGPLAAHADQCLPPDMLWIHGIGGPPLLALGILHRTRSPPPGRHEALPPTPTVGAVAPSIIVLFGESVRRDEVCSARDPACTRSPALDAAAPDRIGYARGFSISSCTELASIALWTGLPITASLEEIATAPLLWDYAKARGVRTAYLASQNLAFQNLGVFVRQSRIDLVREARDRDREAPIDLGTPDEVTTAEAISFLEQGPGPALVFVHFSNTHFPYREIAAHAPYPTSGVPEGVAKRNRYRNSVALNDAVIGDFLRALRATERGRRAIVLSLSDHGEAWDEHGASSHTFDLYAEEIDVPIWIDAPPGSLPEAAIDRLRREAPTRPVSTLDVSATVIDLLGSLDAPGFEARTSRLGGTSLLRDPPPDRAVILRNCSDARYCAPDAFGILAWPIKLHYVGREDRYACHDLSVDPEERSDLPRERCAPLMAITDTMFGRRTDVIERSSRARDH